MRYFTAEDDAYILEQVDKIPWTHIGKHLGRSGSTVYQRWQRLTSGKPIQNKVKLPIAIVKRPHAHGCHYKQALPENEWYKALLFLRHLKKAKIKAFLTGQPIQLSFKDLRGSYEGLQ